MIKIFNNKHKRKRKKITKKKTKLTIIIMEKK